MLTCTLCGVTSRKVANVTTPESMGLGYHIDACPACKKRLLHDLGAELSKSQTVAPISKKGLLARLKGVW